MTSLIEEEEQLINEEEDEEGEEEVSNKDVADVIMLQVECVYVTRITHTQTQI